MSARRQPEADQAEASLLDVLFEEAGAGRCLLGSDGRIARASRAFLEANGLVEAAARGADFLALFPEARAGLEAARAAGAGAIPLPHRADPEGRGECCQERTAVAVTVDGARCLLVTERPRSREGAERQRIEEALRASERQARAQAAELSAILDSVGDGVIVYDREARTVRSTPAADRILGIPASERLRPVHERVMRQYEIRDESGRLIGPTEVAAVRAALHGETIRDQVLRIRVDGQAPRWINLSATPLVLDGQHAGAVLSMTDITGRREATVELRRLVAAVEQTPASVVITDPAGVIQYVNPAFERVTGFARHEAIGARPSLLKSGQHDDEFYRAMWSTIASGQVWKGRLVNRAKDGRCFTEDVVIAPVLGEQGRIENYVAIKRDITEELTLQETIAQSRRLESIGRLAGGVAHDFNNLLTVILSVVEAMRQDLDEQRAVGGDDLDEIAAAGARATDLTRQLLAFARKQAIAPTPLDLNGAVSGMQRLLGRVLGEDIDLQVKLKPGLWTVFADKGQLEQVIMNLAVNARDAMPGGGTLTISTRNLVPEGGAGGAAPGGWVALTVRDTGTGIAPEVMRHIFEPFFTTKEAGQGTGLGLATVYGIVSQAGGEVRVDSQVGAGTTFEIRLPRFAGKREARATQKVEAPARGSESVLLVEDDASVREVTRRALVDGGYRVAVAASGAEAMALLARLEAPPRLMVTDVVMPFMNGRELADKVQAHQPAIRVLYLSGYDPEIIQHHGVIDSGIDFLPKPFTRSSLLAKVRAVLDRG